MKDCHFLGLPDHLTQFPGLEPLLTSRNTCDSYFLETEYFMQVDWECVEVSPANNRYIQTSESAFR